MHFYAFKSALHALKYNLYKHYLVFIYNMLKITKVDYNVYKLFFDNTDCNSDTEE